MDSNRCEKSAVALRRLIGVQQLSPVELFYLCIARIKGFNPAVNAGGANDFMREGPSTDSTARPAGMAAV